MSLLFTIVVRVVVALAITMAAGCTITPIKEASRPTPVPAADLEHEPGPETLAFAANQTEPSDTTSDRGGQLLQDVKAAAWTIIHSADQVGVHSAPGSLYTRVAILGSDNDVIATGRRAEVDGAVWMEIHWANGTAWVLQSPFVLLNF